MEVFLRFFVFAPIHGLQGHRKGASKYLVNLHRTTSPAFCQGILQVPPCWGFELHGPTCPHYLELLCRSNTKTQSPTCEAHKHASLPPGEGMFGCNPERFA
jgi:hypothetical protein